MPVAQTSHENSDTRAEAEAGAVAAEQSIELKINTTSLRKSESTKLKSASSQSWVPRAGIPLALWTTTEDQLLEKMKGEGNSWKEISKALPNRSARAAEAHWVQMQKASQARFLSWT